MRALELILTELKVPCKNGSAAYYYFLFVYVKFSIPKYETGFSSYVPMVREIQK